MLASPLPPSFLDSYNLSITSFGCKALCIFIRFLVLCYIWWSSSLILFKNDTGYLTSGTAEVLIPLMFLCYIVWFYAVFSFSWGTLFCFFFHLHLFDIVHFQYSLVFVNFLFLRTFWLFLDLMILFHALFVVSHFLLLAWHIFLCQILSLYPDCIYPLPVLGFPILFHFWPTVWYHPCRWSFLAI